MRARKTLDYTAWINHENSTCELLGKNGESLVKFRGIIQQAGEYLIVSRNHNTYWITHENGKFCLEKIRITKNSFII